MFSLLNFLKGEIKAIPIGFWITNPGYPHPGQPALVSTILFPLLCEGYQGLSIHSTNMHWAMNKTGKTAVLTELTL